MVTDLCSAATAKHEGQARSVTNATRFAAEKLGIESSVWAEYWFRVYRRRNLVNQPVHLSNVILNANDVLDDARLRGRIHQQLDVEEPEIGVDDDQPCSQLDKFILIQLFHEFAFRKLAPQVLFRPL